MTVCKVIDFLYLTFIPFIFEVMKLKDLKATTAHRIILHSPLKYFGVEC